MTVESRKIPSDFGEITLVKIINKYGASVTLSSLGAGIVSVEVPDKNGRIENVCLAYANPADYMKYGPCLGNTPGRYANRIANGHLEVEGKEYKLAVNCGPHHLHGGPDGFQNRIWDVQLLSNGVRFTLVSPDGDENYPAEVNAAVEYRWSDENELSISLEADADKPTVVNLTNHAYWNLDGADSGCALDHELQIKAEYWLPTDKDLAPTGELQEVEGTPMDFYEAKRI